MLGENIVLQNIYQSAGISRIKVRFSGGVKQAQEQVGHLRSKWAKSTSMNANQMAAQAHLPKAVRGATPPRRERA